jgi:hypothetical protein
MLPLLQEFDLKVKELGRITDLPKQYAPLLKKKWIEKRFLPPSSTIPAHTVLSLFSFIVHVSFSRSPEARLLAASQRRNKSFSPTTCSSVGSGRPPS